VDPASICIPRSSLIAPQFSTSPRISLSANRVDCQNQRIDMNEVFINPDLAALGVFRFSRGEELQ
jgi:hypothetical protein